MIIEPDRSSSRQRARWDEASWGTVSVIESRTRGVARGQRYWDLAVARALWAMCTRAWILHSSLAGGDAGDDAGMDSAILRRSMYERRRIRPNGCP